jgi:hypothetical protein
MAYKRNWRDERIFEAAFRVKIMVNREAKGTAWGEDGLGGFGTGLLNIA